MKSRARRLRDEVSARGAGRSGSVITTAPGTNPYRSCSRTSMRARCQETGRRRQMSERELRLVPAQGPSDVDLLLSRIARGDAGAFESLYDELAATVFGLARRVVRDPARAEDVTQEVFLEVWRKAPRFDRS